MAFLPVDVCRKVDTLFVAGVLLAQSVLGSLRALQEVPNISLNNC
jgi:hypothetical protein